MNPIIDIDNLIFSYDEVQGIYGIRAIDQVTLDIEPGTFTAIIGRNGSGKSTLAKHVNALLLPSEGTVTVGGFDTKDESRVWDIRQMAAMVFQNPDNQIVSAIVEDDVAFGPENLGIEPGEIRDRVDQALASVNMDQFKKKAPHLLSGGQKQRIAIAGAIAMSPRCIVFDEPTAMLDPQGRKEVLGIIKCLNEVDITCILITHFMEEAAEADRVLIMDQGQVKLDGTPSQVFRQVDKLRQLHLDVPMAVDLAYRLRKKGVNLPENIITNEELVEALCQLR